VPPSVVVAIPPVALARWVELPPSGARFLIVVTLIPAGEPKVERNQPPLTPEEIAEQNEVILDAEGA
jgi:hypothetical protein